VQVLDIDPFRDEFIAAPWRELSQIRDAGPVVRLPMYDVCAVSRHEDVVRVLRDSQGFSSAAGVGYVNVKKARPWRAPSIVLEVDKPLHSHTRRVLSQVLSDTALRKLEPEFDRRAVELVDELVDRRDFDAVVDLARRFPTDVFSDAVGLPPGDRAKVLEYGAMAFAGNGPPNDEFQRAAADIDGVARWVSEQCRRNALSSTGFGAQVYRAADRGLITEDEAALLVRSLLSAGLDTTVSALAFAVMRFATNPEQWDLVRQDSGLIQNSVEEVIRIEAPFLMFFRTTSGPQEVSGVEIPADTKVLVFIGGAGRDPRKWERPDEFDVRRDTSGHVGFGYGIHRCVGQALARLELKSILSALAARVTRWTMTGDAAYACHNTLRTLSSLPVTVETSPALVSAATVRGGGR